MRKIGIIDHVGVKAGMDYYSSSLADSLSRYFYVFLFSNIQDFDCDRRFELYNLFQSKNNFGKLTQFFLFFIAYIKSIRICKKENVSYVLVHVFASDLVAFILCVFTKLFGIKVILICHDPESFSNSDSKIISKLIYGFGSDVICVHNNVSKDVLLSNGVEISKVNVVRHGNFINLFLRAPSLASFDLEPNCKYILFFGQIKKVKGLDILLRSLPKIDPSIKLIIAGKVWKDDFSTYHSIINELDLHDRVVLHIRFITDDERDFLFRSVDAIVLPYRKIFQSGVLLMAMSYQLPVIASDLEGNAELVDDGFSGLLFKSGSSVDLAHRINQLFYDRIDLSSKLASNAFHKVQYGYSWDDIATAYDEILRR